MKKTLLFLVGMTAANFAYAQLYFQLKGGYAFRAAPSLVGGISDVDGDNIIDNGIQIETWNPQTQMIDKSSTAIYGSGGQGVTTSLTAGYMFSKHFGAELGVHYYQSERSNPQHTLHILASADNPPTATADFHAQSKQVRLAPAIVIRGAESGISPFIRFGLLIPVAGQVDVDANLVINNNITDGQSDWRQETDMHIVLNGAFSLGYNTAVGVNIPLSKHIGLYAEAELITLSVRPAKSTIVRAEQREYTPQGSTTETDMTKITRTKDVYDREKVYVNSLSQNSNNEIVNPNFDPNKPREELIRITSYNSFGAHLGVRYSF